MERELCIKCSNCQGLMKYDYYANKFKCKGCKNILHLKEIDKNDIDLSTSVFGKKLDSPLFITAITGGHPSSKEINEQLAIVAEENK